MIRKLRALKNDKKYCLLYMKKVWNKALCFPWVIILCILYIIPSVFDFAPDFDSYLGGYGFLGIWGTLVLTALGLLFSFGYGTACVHKQTVYRCAVFGCSEEDMSLVWPNEDTKNRLSTIYRNELQDKDRSSFKSYLPWSDFNRTLHRLNTKYLYD